MLNLILQSIISRILLHRNLKLTALLQKCKEDSTCINSHESLNFGKIILCLQRNISIMFIKGDRVTALEIEDIYYQEHLAK